MILKSIKVTGFPVLDKYEINLTLNRFELTPPSHFEHSTEKFSSTYIIDNQTDYASESIAVNTLMNLIYFLPFSTEETLANILSTLDRNQEHKLARLTIEFYESKENLTLNKYTTSITRSGFMNQHLSRKQTGSMSSIWITVSEELKTSEKCLLDDSIFTSVRYTTDKSQMIDSVADNVDLYQYVDSSIYGDAYNSLINIIQGSQQATEYIVTYMKGCGVKDAYSPSLIAGLSLDKDESGTNHIIITSPLNERGTRLTATSKAYFKAFMAISKVAMTSYFGSSLMFANNIDKILPTVQLAKMLTQFVEYAYDNKSQLICTFSNAAKRDSVLKLVRKATPLIRANRLQEGTK